MKRAWKKEMIRTSKQDDSLVFVAIENGHNRAALIMRSIEILDQEEGDLERRVDRALQRLRKEGRIEFAGEPRRWHIVKKSVTREVADANTRERELGT